MDEIILTPNGKTLLMFLQQHDEVYVGNDCVVGKGTFIGSGSHIKNGTIVGKDCYIIGDIYSSKIGDNVEVINSKLNDVVVEDNAHIGPYSYIHGNTLIKEDSFIGNFVEIKKSVIGKKCKIKHQAILLDCNMDDCCNVGAGVITANYDSKMKHITNIGKKSFIGCNSVLVAPLTIEDDVYIAANSTITKDIAKEEFAISRVEQINKKRRKISI